MSSHPQAHRARGSELTVLAACLAIVGCDSSPTELSTGTAWTAVTAGEQHSCGLTNTGHAFCWGENESGQVGVSPSFAETVPVPVETDLRFTQISAGRMMSCAITVDSEVYCWGEDPAGGRGEDAVARCEQDGVEVSRCTHVPTKVQSDVRFASVAVGGAYKSWNSTVHGGPVCALDIEAAAYCWGYGADGARGDGTSSHTRVPTPVAGDLRFAEIDAADGGACGIADTGELYCWGRDQNHRLAGWHGDRTLEPVRVVEGQDFVSVRVGTNHTCAVKADGDVLCWGINLDGAIGDGTREARDEPTAVDTDLAFVSVAVGFDHTCARTAAGRLYCWGDPWHTGTGSHTLRGAVLLPSAVAASRAFAAVVSSWYHTCALTTTGGASCWGDGWAGQLGMGETGHRAFPTAVAGP